MRYETITLAATLCACGTALAQVDPPPTWGQNDGASVSLSYTFPTGAFPPVADLSVAWDGWGGTQWEKSATLAYMPTLADRSGVWGLPKNTTDEDAYGSLSVHIKNETLLPEMQVWFQFDMYLGGGGSFGTKWTTEPGFTIGTADTILETVGDWERLTSTFSIMPQPPWVMLTFDFMHVPGGGPTAIDNLRIHTHGVPTPAAVSLFALAVIGTAIRRRR